MALLNFTSGIRLTKSINSSRGEWAQQQYVLPYTYKGGDAEFVVTKQQASCLGWSHFCSLLNGKDSNTIASIHHLFKTVPIQVAQCRCQNRRILGRGSRTVRLGRLVTGDKGQDVFYPGSGPLDGGKTLLLLD